MATEPVTGKSATPPTDRALDKRLRLALAPDEKTVDRLVTRALAHPPTRTASTWKPTRSWQFAAGLVVAILMAVALPILSPRSSTPEDRVPVVREIHGTLEAPAKLRISNEAGPVTVTTAASKVVFLAPER